MLQLANDARPRLCAGLSYAAYWHMVRFGPGWSQDSATTATKPRGFAAAADSSATATTRGPWRFTAMSLS